MQLESSGRRTLADVLKNATDGQQPFQVSPFYVPRGDYIALHLESVPHHSVQVTPYVSVLRAMDDNRIVGVNIYGVRELITATLAGDGK